MNEDHVAYHGIVTLLGWKDASSRGPKVTLGLSSRAELEHFDTATRRKGKKAGQRYQASFMTTEAAPVSIGAVELWFAGANWAHQDGARVVFTVTDRDLDLFKTMNPKDSGTGTPTIFWLTLIQVDEDETPINQRKADVVEQATGVMHRDGDRLMVTLSPGDADALEAQGIAVERPKGGPRSKQVAMLCQDRMFQLYVKDMKELKEIATFGEADSYVKRMCCITSKVEFDHSEGAWQGFIATVRRPFLEWAGHASQTA